MNLRLAASILFCGLLSSFAVLAGSAQTSRAATVVSQLKPGQSISLGDRLVSSSGQRTLDLERTPTQHRGLFVDTLGLDLSSEGCGPTYVDSNIDIAAQRSRIVMQHDGNLVWYRGPYAVMSSRTAGHPGAYAVLQNDGLFVVRSPGSGAPLWRMDNACSFLTSTYDEEVARPVYLRPGWFMQDDNRRYRFQMQRDGNLVLTGPRGRPLWSTRTAGNPGAFLVKQTDGNLVVYSPGMRPLWNSRTARRPADEPSFLSVEPNGEVVLYQMDVKAWSTPTAGRT